MFVRTKKRANGTTSIQIVENVRKGDKVVQKVLRHLGQGVTEQEIEGMKDLAEKIICETKNDRNPVLPGFDPYEFYKVKNKPCLSDTSINLQNVVEQKRINLGVKHVFGEVYNQLGFESIIESTKDDKGNNELLKDLVLSRIFNASSKRKSVEILERDFDKEYDLDKVYRFLDILSIHSDKVKKVISNKTASLFEEDIEVIFFDVTTLYFESFEADELRNFGFSKDHKFNQTQIVIALIVNQKNLPISYEVFSGNTQEGTTLINMISYVKNNYSVKNITLVADRAMFTENNLKTMENESISYVVACKLRALNKELKSQILQDDYKLTYLEDQCFWIKNIDLQDGRKLVVSYSKKRALKDKKDRERLIARLEKKIKNNKINLTSLIPNHGSKKFIKIENNTAHLNLDKIEQEEAWDGLHGVITNVKEKELPNVLTRYKNLWRIEDAFRLNKNDLKIRPVYHYKSKRIKAHLSLCFITYTLATYLKYYLEKENIQLSFNRIKEELSRVEVSILKHKHFNRFFALPSQLNPIQKNIYQAFNLKYQSQIYPL